MSSSGLDPYTVVTALPPEPPADPDPAAEAYAAQQAMFAQEQAGSAWTAPLAPARGSRQRIPVPQEDSGDPKAGAVERKAMCILGPDGAHVSRGLHCPHGLPGPGDPDEITATIRF